MRKIKKIFFVGFILLLAGTGLIFFLLNQMIVLEALKPKLETAFTEFLRRPISIESLGWKMFPRPALIGYNVQLKDNENQVLADAPEVEIRISMASLWKRKLDLYELIFANAKGIIRRRENGTLPLAEMIKDILAQVRKRRKDPNSKPPLYVFERIEIENGDLRFIDQMTSEEKLDFYLLLDAYGDIKGQPGARRFPFELKGRVKAGSNEGDLRIAGTLKKYLKVRAVSDRLPLNVFSQHVSFLRNWNGAVQLVLDIEKQASGLWVRVKGKTKNLKPTAEGPFPDLEMAFDIDSKKASELTVNASSLTSNLTFKAQIPDMKTRYAEGNFESSQLDISELAGWIKKIQSTLKSDNKKTRDSGPQKDFDMWELKAGLDLKDVRYRQILLTEMKIKGHLRKDGQIDLNPIQAKGLGGSMEAKGCLFDEPDRYMFSWDIKDIDMEPLVRSLMPKQQFVGIGRTMGQLSGQFGEMAWEKVRGKISIRLKEGVVWGVPGLLKAFSSLNIRSLLKANQNKGEEGFPVNKATVDLKINRGKILIDETGIIENETLQIGLMGSANIIEKTVDGKLVFHFLTVAGEVLKSIPGIQSIFYRNKKSFVPMWVGVRGPLNNPRINILPVKSVTETLWGTVRGVIRFPSDALKRIRK